jgi:uncharacterized membrane protein
MWFWLALASALLGAVDVILSKKALHRVNTAVFTWAIFILPIPFLIFLALREGIPTLNIIFFIATFASSLVFIFSKMIFNHTLKRNLISKIVPLTSFAGFFTYIFGLIFLSESIRLVPLIGLLSIISGAYILNADQIKEDLLKPFKLLFLKKESILFLLAVMLGSLTAILDKWALKNSIPTSPIFTLLVEQVIMSALLTGYLLKRKNKNWLPEFKSNFPILFINSVIFLIVGLLVFYAYAGAPVALVLGIKRLQLFFILLMGYLFFKDKPTKHTWIATAIMILGVLLIKIG